VTAHGVEEVSLEFGIVAVRMHPASGDEIENAAVLDGELRGVTAVTRTVLLCEIGVGVEGWCIETEEVENCCQEEAGDGVKTGLPESRSPASLQHTIIQERRRFIAAVRSIYLEIKRLVAMTQWSMFLFLHFLFV